MIQRFLRLSRVPSSALRADVDALLSKAPSQPVRIFFSYSQPNSSSDRGMWVAEYSNETDATAARDAVQEGYVGTRPVGVTLVEEEEAQKLSAGALAYGGRGLMVRGLPPSIAQADLGRFINEVMPGAVVREDRVRVMVDEKTSTTFAHVEMPSASEAHQASRMRHRVLLAGKKVDCIVLK